MTDTDLKRLEEEKDAISKRMNEASTEERPMLERQYGERLSHLTARLEAAYESRGQGRVSKEKNGPDGPGKAAP